mgnify:CR=1 FL=1
MSKYTDNLPIKVHTHVLENDDIGFKIYVFNGSADEFDWDEWIRETPEAQDQIKLMSRMNYPPKTG